MFIIVEITLRFAIDHDWLVIIKVKRIFNTLKDLNKIGRDVSRVIICDNSPASYIFHPDNAVIIFMSNSIITKSPR